MMGAELQSGTLNIHAWGGGGGQEWIILKLLSISNNRSMRLIGSEFWLFFSPHLKDLRR